MAKLENLDFGGYAFLLFVDFQYFFETHLDWYFVQNIIFRIFDFFPIIKAMIYH